MQFDNNFNVLTGNVLTYVGIVFCQTKRNKCCVQLSREYTQVAHSIQHIKIRQRKVYSDSERECPIWLKSHTVRGTVRVSPNERKTVTDKER